MQLVESKETHCISVCTISVFRHMKSVATTTFLASTHSLPNCCQCMCVCLQIVLDSGDVSDQISLRERLSCHPFKWFVDNVFPALFAPEDALRKGRVRSLKSLKNARTFIFFPFIQIYSKGRPEQCLVTRDSGMSSKQIVELATCEESSEAC